MSEKNQGAALTSVLALFDVQTVEQLEQLRWNAEPIDSTQIKRVALLAAQAELDQQKRSILSRLSMANPLTPSQIQQIAEIEQTRERLVHILYQLENWLIASSHPPKLKQQRRRRKA
jgi:hypothetical protein